MQRPHLPDYSGPYMYTYRANATCRLSRTDLGTTLYLLFLQLVNLLAEISYAGQQRLHCCDTSATAGA